MNIKQMFTEYQTLSETAKGILMECGKLVIYYEQTTWGENALPENKFAADDIVKRYADFLVEARNFLTMKNDEFLKLKENWKHRKTTKLKVMDLNWALIELFSDLSGHVQFIQEKGMYEIIEAIKLKDASRTVTPNTVIPPSQVNQ